MVRLLFILLLLPRLVSAQHFIVKESNVCKCDGYPTYVLTAASLNQHIIVTIEILDPQSPKLGDTLFFNEPNWWYHKKVLQLYRRPIWQKKQTQK